jgi:hypothetical protein
MQGIRLVTAKWCFSKVPEGHLLQEDLMQKFPTMIQTPGAKRPEFGHFEKLPANGASQKCPKGIFCEKKIR